VVEEASVEVDNDMLKEEKSLAVKFKPQSNFKTYRRGRKNVGERLGSEAAKQKKKVLRKSNGLRENFRIKQWTYENFR
jgi:hypothetical protein